MPARMCQRAKRWENKTDRIIPNVRSVSCDIANPLEIKEAMTMLQTYILFIHMKISSCADKVDKKHDIMANVKRGIVARYIAG